MKEIDGLRIQLLKKDLLNIGCINQWVNLIIDLWNFLILSILQTKLNQVSMKMLTTTGARLLYAIPMAIFGLFHFMNGSQMAGMVPSFIPGGIFWVYLTGLALVLAAVAIIIQKQARLASLLLAAMLILFVLNKIS